MPPPNLRAEPPKDFIPVWIREPWPILAVIGLVAIAFFAVGDPLLRLERLWTDLLLRVRSQAHLAPKPDGRIFLVGLETKNLAGDSTVAAEYKTYAEIVNMLSDLRVSVVALDFMMVRGRPEDAQEVLAAIRSSGRVVLAQARTPEMLARSFLFAPPGEFEEGRVNIAADSDGVHRRYACGIAEAQGGRVFVAANAIAVGDGGATPFGRFEPLVDLHATALDDLMQGQMLTELPPLWNGVLITVVLVLLASFTRRIRSVRTFAMVIVGSIVLLLIAGAGLLFARNLVIYAITPVSFLLLSLLTESGRRSNLASIEKAQLRANLGRYFSPRVLEEVLRDPNAFKPREVEITVLLTDVRNFTTITEGSGTQRMFDLLNDVFEVQTRAVLSLDGSMEHFVGDQFVAYWGAPSDQPDDADLALRAAAIIFKGLDELKETLGPRLRGLFGYGLSLHSGRALFG